MINIKNLSIKNKLLGLILFVSFTMIVLGFSVVIINYVYTLKKNMIDNIMINAKLIGEYSVAPMSFDQREGAQEILEKLQTIPSIVNGYIFYKNGELFASYQTNQNIKIDKQLISHPRHQFKNKFLHATRQIIYHNTNYGTIYLVASTHELNLTITRYLGMMIIIILVLFIISYYLALKLQNIISQPLQTLVKTTQTISQEGDYSIRVTKYGNDEIGQLYDEFNEMLEQIQERESARNNAENAVRESEFRYRTLFQLSPIPIFVHSNKHFVFLNNAAIETLGGQTSGEFIGKSIHDIILPDIFPKEDLLPTTETRTKQAEKRFLRLDNQIIYVESVENQIEYKGNPATQVVFQDISDRKKAEQEILKLNEELEKRVQIRTDQLKKINQSLKKEIRNRKYVEKNLRESEERFRAIFESTSDGIIVWDRNFICLYANKAFYKYSGIEKRKITGKSIDAGLGNFMDYIPRWRQRINQVLESGEPVWAEDSTTINDKQVFGESILSPIQNEKMEIFAVGVIYRDITERKLYEEKIKNYAGKLEEANKELEAFSYSVSHDLRAPLRSIDAFSKIVLEEELSALSENGKKYVQIVRDNAAKMGLLIQDLLDFSRLSRKPLIKQKVNIKEMVEYTIKDLYANYAPQNPAIIQEPSLDVEIKADASLLKQVFINIIDNALKYSSKNPNPQINIGSLRQNNELVFYIKDNGVGFDMKYADKLFGVFQRLHRSDEFSGTGVGLAIVNRIITRHGGRIWAEAGVNSGATFYFTVSDN